MNVSFDYISEDSMRNLQITDDELLIFYNSREKLLEFFRANSDLFEEPYEVMTGSSKSFVHKGYGLAYKSVFQSVFTNPIYLALAEWGLISIIVDPSNKDNWQSAEFPKDIDREINEIGCAIIELSVDVVELLNIYIPNKSLIHNIYFANVQTDAIGRVITNAAEVAIAKLIVRVQGSISSSISNEEIQMASHLIVWVKADFSANEGKAKLTNGLAFERQYQSLLGKAGFEVQRTPSTGDFGADLIAHKYDLRYVIQCKDLSKPVGIKGVQEIIGAQRHYNADYAVVCCSGEFTDAAVALASSNKVILCNDYELARRLDAV